MKEVKCMGKREEHHGRGSQGENVKHISHIKSKVCRNSVIAHVILS